MIQLKAYLNSFRRNWFRTERGLWYHWERYPKGCYLTVIELNEETFCWQVYSAKRDWFYMRLHLCSEGTEETLQDALAKADQAYKNV